jgi:hypothetical protein
LAATHVDAIHGIIDYLDKAGFKGEVVVAESSAGETLQGYDNFKYGGLAAEHRNRKVTLVDLNQEAKYKVIHLLNYDIHTIPVRLAARLMDL